MANFITEKIKIKNCSDYQFIKNKVNNYSHAFRDCYKFFDLIKDPIFRDKIKLKYNLNEVEFRSLVIDIETTIKQTITNKEKLSQEILDLTEYVNGLKERLEKKEYKTSKEKEFLIRNLFKTNKKLQEKSTSLDNEIVFGTRDLLSDITRLHNQINNFDNLNHLEGKTKEEKKMIRNEKMILINNLKSKTKEFKENRKQSFYIVGDAAKKGNRHFNLTNLSNNEVILKFGKETKTKIIIELFNYFNKKNLFGVLESLATNCSQSITCRLDENYIYITYDLEIIKNTQIDNKAKKEEYKLLKDKVGVEKEVKEQYYKNIAHKYHKERETRIITNNNSLECRVAAVDLNPTNIGFSVVEYSSITKEYKVIHTECFDFSELCEKTGKNSTHKSSKYQVNKRKYELIQTIKQIFNIAKHYKCAYFVHEDLNFNDKVGEFFNKESNRKIKNLWNKDLTERLITKYCNQCGLIESSVNPWWSSFIGNMLYNYIDSINASIEIAKRNLNMRYGLGFYPEINNRIMGTIIDTMTRLNPNRLSTGDVQCLKDCSSWVGIYDYIKNLNKHPKGDNTYKFRWRFGLDDIPQEDYSIFSLNTRKSMVKKYKFLTH